MAKLAAKGLSFLGPAYGPSLRNTLSYYQAYEKIRTCLHDMKINKNNDDDSDNDDDDNNDDSMDDDVDDGNGADDGLDPHPCEPNDDKLCVFLDDLDFDFV